MKMIFFRKLYKLLCSLLFLRTQAREKIRAYMVDAIVMLNG